MLSLTRCEGEAVIIGDGHGRVVVHVVRIKGDKVQLSFDAPREVPVDRAEVRASKEQTTIHAPFHVEDLGFGQVAVHQHCFKESSLVPTLPNPTDIVKELP